MNLKQGAAGEARLAAYVEALASVVGHVDRAGSLRDYCIGLMLPGERKSVEPMAAMQKNRPIEAWIIDDTSFPKQGKHSVGVHHQYVGSSASRPFVR